MSKYISALVSIRDRVYMDFSIFGSHAPDCYVEFSAQELDYPTLVVIHEDIIPRVCKLLSLSPSQNERAIGSDLQLILAGLTPHEAFLALCARCLELNQTNR